MSTDLKELAETIAKRIDYHRQGRVDWEDRLAEDTQAEEQEEFLILYDQLMMMHHAQTEASFMTNQLLVQLIAEIQKLQK